MAQVLLSPLNWGLGHAMRDLPIIQTLQSRGHDVTIAATGNALTALQREIPTCRCIDFPDYPSPYSAGRFFLPKFFMYFPVLLNAVAAERRNLARILGREKYDLIISDNRLGVYSNSIPSLFITHQLHYHMPLALWPVELFALEVNKYLHANFNRIIVPDNPPGPHALAGKLSRPEPGITSERTFFSGTLTSVVKSPVPQDLDFLVLISGPEPQRTRFEEILLPQAMNLDGSTIVLLGSPLRNNEPRVSDSCTVKPYVSNDETRDLMNRARIVICRSGYTSMMELAELEKHAGLFIPTPGQTEQEYLSWYYERQGWFLSKSQYKLDLPDDIPQVRKFSGFPPMPKTSENVSRLYNNVLAGYLE